MKSGIACCESNNESKEFWLWPKDNTLNPHPNFGSISIGWQNKKSHEMWCQYERYWLRYKTTWFLQEYIFLSLCTYIQFLSIWLVFVHNFMSPTKIFNDSLNISRQSPYFQNVFLFLFPFYPHWYSLSS